MRIVRRVGQTYSFALSNGLEFVIGGRMIFDHLGAELLHRLGRGLSRRDVPGRHFGMAGLSGFHHEVAVSLVYARR